MVGTKVGAGARRITILAVVALLAQAFAFAATASSAPPSCSAAGLAVTSLHDSRFYIDSGTTPPLTSTYVGYRVTNSTGAALTDRWVRLEGFSGGKVGLASGETGRFQIASLANGSSTNAFFYLNASGATTTAQSHTVTVYDRRPDLPGASAVCQAPFSFTGVYELIEANSNKVNSVSISPNPPALGGTFTLTVQGATGVVGAGPATDPGVITLTPTAGNAWPAGAFRLLSTSIQISPDGSAPAQTYANTLYRPNSSGPDRSYTITYTFAATGTTASSTPLHPLQNIASGTQVKHTSTSSYASLAPIQPASNTTTLSVAASPTTLPVSGGTAAHTVTVTNTGATAVALDDLSDRIPAGTSYVAGTSRFNGAAVAEPATSGGSLVWTGPFSVPAGTSRTLTYDLAVPGTAGTYTNSVVGHIGSTQIDRTTLTSDDAPATVTVIVPAPNQAPVAHDDEVATDEDVPVDVDVLANDTDADGDPLVVTTVGAPAHGSAAINGDGTVRYAPAADYHGAVTFTYTIADGHGGTASATVAVTVASVNDPPVAVDDEAETTEGVGIDVDVLANDTDPDGDPIHVVAVGTPSHGTATLSGDGTIRYTPDAGFAGHDAFTYTIADPDGATDTATVAIAVRPHGNHPPEAANDTFWVNAGSPADLDVLANDTDLNGDSLAVVSVSPSSHGIVTINSDGTVRYTPGAGFHGTDTFTYVVSDGGGGTASATVTVHVNAVPVTSGFGADLDQGTSIVLDLVAHALDADGDDLTITDLGSPEHGTLTVLDDGTVRYTPDPGFHGTDSFTYRVTDGRATSAAATVTLAVHHVNQAPAAGPDTLLVNGSGTVDVLANDTDVDGDTLSISALGTPAHGTVALVDGVIRYEADEGFCGADTFTYTVVDGEGGSATGTVDVRVNCAPVAGPVDVALNQDTWVDVAVLLHAHDTDDDVLTVTATGAAGHGTVEAGPGDTVRYTPAPAYRGPDEFTYTVSDPHGATATGTVSVTVLPVNHPPSVSGVSVTTPEDTPVALDVLAGASDPDDDLLSVASVTRPAHGTAVVSGGGIVYTPAADYHGRDTFRYVVTDGNGGTAQARARITVTPVNDPPVARADRVNAQPGVARTIDVLRNDRDVDGDTLVVVSVGRAAHGAVTLSGRSVRYRASARFIGTDGFDYTISDGHGGSATGRVTVTVTSVPEGSVRARLVLDLPGGRRPGVPGVVARLSRPAGAAAPLAVDALRGLAVDALSCRTGGDGSCALAHVPVGTYRLRFDPATIPAGVRASLDPDARLDLATVVTVTTDGSAEATFGIAGSGRIGGSVVSDDDRDGRVSKGDRPLPRVTIEARFAGLDGRFGTTDDVVVRVRTDSAGRFSLGGLPDGRFRVAVVASTVPAGFAVPGPATVELAPGRRSATVPIPLRPSEPGPRLPFTGSSPTPLVVLGTALVAVGRILKRRNAPGRA
jgi:uncharacterized repeat protein (TIGR01451 family)